MGYGLIFASLYLISDFLKKKISFKLISLFLAVLGFHCWAQAFPSCVEAELLFIVVHWI